MGASWFRTIRNTEFLFCDFVKTDNDDKSGSYDDSLPIISQEFGLLEVDSSSTKLQGIIAKNENCFMLIRSRRWRCE